MTKQPLQPKTRDTLGTQLLSHLCEDLLVGPSEELSGGDREAIQRHKVERFGALLQRMNFPTQA